MVNIVLGKRMVPVAGASANSAELLTKADFCTAFTYIALTKFPGTRTESELSLKR